MNDMPLICIDPGHGGKDSGAVGPTGAQEKNVALLVAKELSVLLEAAGLRTVMTRDRDTYVGLSERAGLANGHGADLLLSIHCNAAGGHGHEVFTSPGQTRSDDIATAIYKAYDSAFPMLPGRPNYGDGDPDKEARFTVLTKTIGSAVLYELEFIDTRRGEAFLTDATTQKRMARALADGLVSYYGIEPEAKQQSQQALVVTVADKLVSTIPINAGAEVTVRVVETMPP